MKEQSGAGTGLDYRDRVPLKGTLHYRIIKDGKILEEVEDENLIVTLGRVQLARLLAGNFTNRNINRIAFGTNGTAPKLTDTIITGSYMKSISAIEYPADGVVQFNWKLETTEANGKAILEFGLICADSSLFSRRVRESGKAINKESDISLDGYWRIEF